jgi:hypothetical protein
LWGVSGHPSAIAEQSPIYEYTPSATGDLGHLLDFSCILQQNALWISMALALSSEQLELLHGAAAAVPPNWRARFLSRCRSAF